MSENKKIPTKCNHCNSTDIVHHVWGRVEYYSCKSCKNEVTYVEETKPSADSYYHSPWTSWDPKEYGLTFPTGTNAPTSNTTSPTTSDAFYFDDTDGSIDLIMDFEEYVKNRFPGN